MKELRKRFDRFCFRNRQKGIPNLMLYLSIGSALVYFMSAFASNDILYYWLCFDRGLILQGQIWRLFTYPLTYNAGNVLLTAISLLCYYSIGRAIENMWGTLRFNLYYLSGVVLMDIFCLIFGGYADVVYLNLSLFLAYATMFPSAQFLLMFIIPVRAWIFALVDLALTLYEVVMLASYGLIPYCFFPLVAILNYFLFFGKDVLNVIPLSWRKRTRSTGAKPKQPKVVQFPGSGNTEKAVESRNYTHKCSVCGRTDVSNPELEFRYCSRCNGYHCYCSDHISSHTHVE